MKKMKIGLFIIALVLVGIVVFQNQEYFIGVHFLIIDLYFIKFEIIGFYNFVMLIFCFTIGFLVSFISFIFYKLRLSKTIRRLRSKEHTLNELVLSLKKELIQYKKNSILDNHQ